MPLSDFNPWALYSVLWVVWSATTGWGLDSHGWQACATQPGHWWVGLGVMQSWHSFPTRTMQVHRATGWWNGGAGENPKFCSITLRIRPTIQTSPASCLIKGETSGNQPFPVIFRIGRDGSIILLGPLKLSPQINRVSAAKLDLAQLRNRESQGWLSTLVRATQKAAVRLREKALTGDRRLNSRSGPASTEFGLLGSSVNMESGDPWMSSALNWGEQMKAKSSREAMGGQRREPARDTEEKESSGIGI